MTEVESMDLHLPQVLFQQSWFVGVSKNNSARWLRRLEGDEPVAAGFRIDPLLEVVEPAQHHTSPELAARFGPGCAAKYRFMWDINLLEPTMRSVLDCYQELIGSLRAQ